MCSEVDRHTNCVLVDVIHHTLRVETAVNLLAHRRQGGTRPRRSMRSARARPGYLRPRRVSTLCAAEKSGRAHP
jgi:hypothetical protein